LGERVCLESAVKALVEVRRRRRKRRNIGKVSGHGVKDK